MLSERERLTDEERRLLNAIRRECRRRGEARSLFQVGVILAGLEYRQAWSALEHLEHGEQLVKVLRAGSGRELVMKEVV